MSGRVGRYTLIYRLGQGGVANVFLARRDGSNEASVATKLRRGSCSEHFDFVLNTLSDEEAIRLIRELENDTPEVEIQPTSTPIKPGSEAFMNEAKEREIQETRAWKKLEADLDAKGLGFWT